MLSQGQKNAPIVWRELPARLGQAAPAIGLYHVGRELPAVFLLAQKQMGFYWQLSEPLFLCQERLCPSPCPVLPKGKRNPSIQSPKF